VDYLINDQEKTPKGLLYLNEWGSLGIAANSALIKLQVNTHLYCQYLQTSSLSYCVTQEIGLNYVHYKHGGLRRKAQDE